MFLLIQPLLLTYLICVIKYELVNATNLTIISKTHSGYLEKYKSYADVIVMHFEVPEEVPFVSFKFEGDEMDFSIFGCDARDIELYLKRGSPPVINPDSSKVPEKFLKDGRPLMYKLNFKSDQKSHYVNITSPIPGSYFAAVYHPYVDPHSEAIKQEGLTPMCNTYLDATLYGLVTEVPELILEGGVIHVNLMGDEIRVYKFYVPQFVDCILLNINNASWNESAGISFNVHPSNTTSVNINSTLDYNYRKLFVEEDAWYFVTVSLITDFVMLSPRGELKFSLHYLRNELQTNISETYYKNAVMKSFKNDHNLYDVPYKEYQLIRLGNTDSFVYSYEMKSLDGLSIRSSSLNISSTDLTVLKFKLNDFIDVGGTLHFVLSYKPNEKINKSHVIIACIHDINMMLPKWPNLCKHDNGTLTNSQIVLNGTSRNSSVLIPYPESGVWYATIQLYCEKCEQCNCSDNCKNDLLTCKNDCEMNCNKCIQNCSNNCVGKCTDNCTGTCDENCHRCSENCEEDVKNKKGCENCDCYEDCKRSETGCNSSLIFDIGSYPCVVGSCGKHGKCVFSVAEGFIYSACLCTNNYKGWDCMDDTDASTFGMILLELLLLVLSNLGFLPAAYIAYKRGYKIESIVYLSTFTFSSFYHACDAGENTISFCIVRLSVLQFSDFYCGLLSIWVTLIAMAYLSDKLASTMHITGCILLAFGTTYNKTSLWVFLLPFLVGLIIILISWYLKYRKTGRLFPSKRYVCLILPFGVAVVAIALIMYALLQTNSNYKYLHSLWHVMMAIGVIILLPNLDTFLPNIFT